MKINKIAVVGGGTAGYVAALVLKTRLPNLTIDVICSKKIGIIGVGEGSTEHWNEFLKYIGVSWKDVIKYCDSTFKSGIMFKGWADNDYLHSTMPDFELKTGQYLITYAHAIANGFDQKYTTSDFAWRNVLLNEYIESSDAPFNQYHFNTHKLNNFLQLLSNQRGIGIIDDEITDIRLDEQGNIKSIKGATDYFYDFYIDCTGFKRVLISRLGAKWQSYSKFLKMKSAIVFPLPDTEEKNIWTTAQTMDYGWMFNIPVWDRSGNGYIFDSDYITADQAHLELEKLFGRTIEIGKHIQFDPGALDNVWIKNCVAMGLCANFVEPLEATSIGTTIQQSFLLMHKIINYDDTTIHNYNKSINGILENIRDFICLHYQTNKKNTNFWQDVSLLELPDSLKDKLARWKKNLPIEEDFQDLSRYILFRETNFIQIMHGLKLFDLDHIKYEYDMQRPEIKTMAIKAIDNIKNLEKTSTCISHKKFLHLVRNNY